MRAAWTKLLPGRYFSVPWFFSLSSQGLIGHGFSMGEFSIGKALVKPNRLKNNNRLRSKCERRRTFSASTFNFVRLWWPTNSTTRSKITQLIVIALKGESLTLLYALIKSCDEIQNFLSSSTHRVFICVRLHSVIFQCWLKNLGATPQGVCLHRNTRTRLREPDCTRWTFFWQVINHGSTDDITYAKGLRQRDSIWNAR